MNNNEIFRTFWGHVDDLRSTLLRILIVVGVSFFICLLFSEKLINFLQPSFVSHGNYQEDTLKLVKIKNSTNSELVYSLPTGSMSLEGIKIGALSNGIILAPESELIYVMPEEKNHLLLLGPLEGFFLTFKIAFWAAIFISSPLWIYFLMKFVLPALKLNEKKLLIPLAIGSFAVFVCGIIIAHKWTIPFANRYFQAFNTQVGTNAWALGNYLDYVLFLYGGHIIILEICLSLLLLVHFGLFPFEWLETKRKHMIVLAFILGALLTPPDIVTQFMMAIPLIAVFELVILYGKIKYYKRWKGA